MRRARPVWLLILPWASSSLECLASSRPSWPSLQIAASPAVWRSRNGSGLTIWGSIPLLGSVAKGNRRSPADYVVTNPFSVFSEAFRNLKVSVLQSYPQSGAAVVAVTSPLSGEGKTTTSVCLGETSSLQGSRTIIVDCDLRRRTLQRFLTEAPTIGLVEVIEGSATLDDVVVVDERTGVHYLPLAQGKLTASDVFGGVAMDALLADLRQRYDFIILDTAPLLALADARTLAAKCDAVVLLCRWRKTPKDALKSALRLLVSSGGPIGRSGVDSSRCSQAVGSWLWG